MVLSVGLIVLKEAISEICLFYMFTMRAEATWECRQKIYH